MPKKAITANDMRDQVVRALGAFADEHDIDAIVDQLKGWCGLVDIDSIDPEIFWLVAEKHML